MYHFSLGKIWSVCDTFRVANAQYIERPGNISEGSDGPEIFQEILEIFPNLSEIFRKCFRNFRNFSEISEMFPGLQSLTIYDFFFWDRMENGRISIERKFIHSRIHQL